MKVETLAASDLYKTALNLNQKVGKAENVDEPGFADALETALKEMRSTVEAGERAAAEAMAGKGDIQSVVEALTATEMALETAVVMRDRVVEAYQEILRMPI